MTRLRRALMSVLAQRGSLHCTPESATGSPAGPSRRAPPSTAPWPRAFAAEPAPGDDGDYETVIGLEIHCQIGSASKLFSPAPAGGGLGVRANAAVAPFDLAVPGTLPVTNRACVVAAAKAGLALGGRVQNRSSFERKHYFYPDQPHGYQITQRAEPIVLGGAVDIDTPGRGPRRVAIARVQLETDTAQTTGGGALLDFNRAGTGLLEVVTEPDMRSADEAVALVGEVQSILRAAGVSGCQMEHGQFRVDVNVSCRGRRGGGATGRSELKNMISLKFIRRAIEAEARRHQDALRRGEALAPETRGYDAASGRSYPLRSKEDAPDYRYMPEPDLPGVVLTDGEIAALARELPELPQRARERLQAAGVPGDTAGVLSRRPELLALVDGVKAAGGEAVGGLADVARFVAHEAVAAAARAGGGAGGAGGAGDSARLGRLDAAAVAEVLAAERAGRLNRRLARDVLARVAAGDGAPVSELVAAAGGGAAAGPGAGPDASLEELCRGVLARDDMARAVANWRAGVKRSNMLRAFLGQLMKETGGRADARRATAVIEGLLRGEGGGGGGSD